MKKLISTIAATSLIFSQATMAAPKAIPCDPQKAARIARVYADSARDMQMIANDFKEMHESAKSDQTHSFMIFISSLSLLFIGEAMVASTGAAFESYGYGVVGKAAASHMQLVESAAEYAASRVKNEFVGALAGVLTPAITVPTVDPLVAWGILESKYPESTIKENKILAQTLTEDQLKAELARLQQVQSHLIDQAPNRYLDGLTLGTLDKRWTFRTWDNMQKIADLSYQMAQLKANQSLECSARNN